MTGEWYWAGYVRSARWLPSSSYGVLRLLLLLSCTDKRYGGVDSLVPIRGEIIKRIKEIDFYRRLL